MRRLLSFFLILFFVFSILTTDSIGEKVSYKLAVTLNKAKELMKEGEFHKAIELLTSHIKETKNPHYMVLFALGNCYLQISNYLKAVKYYKKSVEIKSDYYPAWINLARACYDLKKYRESAKFFLKAFELSRPKNPDLLFYSAISYFYAKDLSRSSSIIQRLLKSYKKRAKLEWKNVLVHIYFAKKDFKSALPLVEELSDKTNGDEKKRWQEMRLYLYLKLNKKDKAFWYLNLLLKEYPLEVDWWNGLVHYYLQENRYKSALVALIVKDFIKPLNHQEIDLAAKLCIFLNIPDKALEFYKRTLKTKRDVNTLKAMAQCYILMFKPEEALRWIDVALSKRKDYDLLMVKGKLLYELKRYSDAIMSFIFAIKIKASPEAYLMIAYSYLELNKFDKARVFLKPLLKYERYKKTAYNLLIYLRNHP